MRPVRCTFLDAVTYRDPRARRGITRPGLGSHDMRDSGRPALVMSMKMRTTNVDRENNSNNDESPARDLRVYHRFSFIVFCHDIDRSTAGCAGVMQASLPVGNGSIARPQPTRPRSRAREHMPAIALDRHRHFLDRAAFG